MDTIKQLLIYKSGAVKIQAMVLDPRFRYHYRECELGKLELDIRKDITSIPMLERDFVLVKPEINGFDIYQEI